MFLLSTFWVLYNIYKSVKMFLNILHIMYQLLSVKKFYKANITSSLPPLINYVSVILGEFLI